MDILITNDIINNININRLVGFLRAVDPNEGDTHTFELDASELDKFKLIDDQLWALDVNSTFEGEPDISVTIVVTDQGGLTFSRPLVIKKMVFEDITQIYPGSAITDYRMFSMPTSFTTLTNGIINAQIKIASESNRGEVWVIYQYSPSVGYKPLHINDVIYPGNGFWILVNDKYGGVIFDDWADPVVINERGEFELLLEDGWNLIGNPFREILNWDDVLSYNIDQGYIEDGQVSRAVTYDGSYNIQSSLKIMEGAFVFSSGATDFFLKKSGYSNVRDQKTMTHSISNELGRSGWSLQIKILSNNLQTNMCGIGMSSSSSNGIDNNDIRTPPSPNEDFDFGWKDSFGLSTNIVAVQENYVWEYDIKANGGDLELQWDKDQNASLSKEIWLELIPQHRFVNMNELDKVKFKTKANQSIRIHYGILPDMYQVEIYPNPASHAMNFRISSSDIGKLLLKIVDLNGNMVTKQTIDILKGQTYWDWDMMDHNGQKVQPGIYFCEIFTRNEAKKIIKLVVDY